MNKIYLMVMVAVLLGCTPAALSPEMPLQVVGPENHALVLDGLS